MSLLSRSDGPNLEYHLKDMRILEIHEKADKIFLGFQRLTYEQQLKKIILSSLNRRQKRGDLIKTYKIITGKFKVNRCKVPLYSILYHRDNRHKLCKNNCNLQFRESFTQRVVYDWNTLPDARVSAQMMLTRPQTPRSRPQHQCPRPTRATRPRPSSQDWG